MKREKFIAKFHELSPEDQAAVRAELTGEAAPFSCPPIIREHVTELIRLTGQMGVTDDPVAVCERMISECECMKGLLKETEQVACALG